MLVKQFPLGPMKRVRVDRHELSMTDHPRPFLLEIDGEERRFKTLEILGPSRFELTAAKRDDGCGSDWTLKLATEAEVVGFY